MSPSVSSVAELTTKERFNVSTSVSRLPSSRPRAGPSDSTLVGEPRLSVVLTFVSYVAELTTEGWKRDCLHVNVCVLCWRAHDQRLDRFNMSASVVVEITTEGWKPRLFYTSISMSLINGLATRFNMSTSVSSVVELTTEGWKPRLFYMSTSVSLMYLQPGSSCQRLCPRLLSSRPKNGSTGKSHTFCETVHTYGMFINSTNV